MSDREVCACGRFEWLPTIGGQLEDGVRHLAVGVVDICEIVMLREGCIEAEKARDAAESALAEAREVLREVEWGVAHECPECWGLKENGHTPDCRLARAMSADPGRGRGE